MARIRTIKPDFFTSEDVVSLSPLARLLYIATWVEADREGRLVWRPKTLKLRYLPGDQCDIDELAEELVSAGLVIPYESGGQAYAEVPTFARHQVVNNRESASVIPARVNDATGTRDDATGTRDDATGTRDSRDSDASLTRDDATGTPLMGKEGKGKEVHITRRVIGEQEDDAFSTFWQQYPKKVSKPQALKAWNKLKPSGQLLANLMAGLERQKRSADWQKDDGRFIPHPATWLNGRRWEDEPPASPAAQANVATVTPPKPGDRMVRHGRQEVFDECLGWVPA